MGDIWFCLVALMLAGYVVLDGFDLGAGAIHIWIARTDAERRQVLQTIGPVWDGNEVWLVAAGGTIYFAFPALYASSFSGFYLPLMMVLWLLILRGVAVEFRSHIAGAVWAGFWDVIFWAASLLLAIFYGAALGNVVRGVPLDAQGRFFEPLWTNFRLGPEAGILDWYTILTGVTGLGALVLHGALWVALKTAGALSDRARAVARRAWTCTVALTVILTAVTFRVQPQVRTSLAARPWGFGFPLIAVAGLAAMIWFLRRKNDRRAFLGSCVYLVGMLTSVAFGLYPYLLPSTTRPEYALTVESAKAQDYGLKIGLAWWLIGMALAVTYQVFTYRRFAGKVASSAGEGY